MSVRPSFVSFPLLLRDTLIVYRFLVYTATRVQAMAHIFKFVVPSFQVVLPGKTQPKERKKEKKNKDYDQAEAETY